MFLRVASTPRVVAAPSASAANAAPAGLGFVPRLVRGSGARPLLQIPVPSFILRYPRGVGAAAPTGVALPSNACQYKLPGIAQDPSIPFCGSGGYQMSAAQIAAVLASQKAGGYSDVSGGAFAPGVTGPTGILPLAGSSSGTRPVSSGASSASAAVAPRPASNQVTYSYSPATGVTTSAPASTAPTIATTTGPATVFGGSPLAFLEDPVSLFGFTLPVWVVGLGAAGLAWVLTSHGGKH